MRNNPFDDLIPQNQSYANKGNPFDDLVPSGDTSIGRDLAIGAKNAGVGLATAIPDTLSFVGNSPYYAANVAGYLSGNDKLKNLPAPLPYLSQNINQGIDEATNNYFQPRNLQEKIIGTASNFVGGGKGLAEAGATKASQLAQKFLAPKTARDYASLATAGAGTEFGREVAPDSPATQIAGGVLGSLVPGAHSSIASALKINPSKLESFQQAGLKPTLADVSDSRFVKGVQNNLVETPFAGYKITDAIKDTNNKIASRESGLTQEGAGELAQNALRGYQQKGSKIAERLEDNLSKYILPNDNIKINNTLSAIKNKPLLYTRARQQAFNKSELGKRYNEIIETSGIKKYSDDVYFPNNNKNSFPYNDLRDLRQAIDNEITTFGKYGSKEQGALKYLRSQIQEDIKSHLKEIGPNALHDFNRYNKFYSAFAKKNENIINGLLKDKTATQTFRNITNGLRVDARDANAVMRSLKPDQKQVFSHGLIRELGMNPQNEFNSANLATNFKKLEPQAQDIALAGLDKQAQKQFRATIDSIDAMKDTKALSNHSRTFNNAIIAGTTVGGITHPIATATLLGAANLTARLMTNQSFLSWLAKGIKLNTPEEIANHIGALERISKASPEIGADVTKYLNSIKDSQSNPASEAFSKEEALKEIERRQGNKDKLSFAPEASNVTGADVIKASDSNGSNPLDSICLSNDAYPGWVTAAPDRSNCREDTRNTATNGGSTRSNAPANTTNKTVRNEYGQKEHHLQCNQDSLDYYAHRGKWNDPYGDTYVCDNAPPRGQPTNYSTPQAGAKAQYASYTNKKRLKGLSFEELLSEKIKRTRGV